jgi:hypothetical protein
MVAFSLKRTREEESKHEFKVVVAWVKFILSETSKSDERRNY